jgi:hypothetical protein
MEIDLFETLSAFSGKLHGHKYVFPVAVWLLGHQSSGPITQPEIRTGLIHAESNRIFEALERLAEIGAVRELPRVSGRRYFETSASLYWKYAEAQAKALGAHAEL